MNFFYKGTIAKIIMKEVLKEIFGAGHRYCTFAGVCQKWLELM